MTSQHQTRRHKLLFNKSSDIKFYKVIEFYSRTLFDEFKKLSAIERMSMAIKSFVEFVFNL